MTSWSYTIGFGAISGGRPLTFRQSQTTITKYYYFNGQRLAQRNGSTLSYLQADQLGGMALSTSSAGNATLGHRAYGRMRIYSGSTPTRYQFTGQYIDDTGLQYFNARYYDPDLGQFLGAPLGADTLVPKPECNQYLYVTDSWTLRRQMGYVVK